MPLDEAFDVLVSNKIHCAPVYDESAGAYVGFLDVADVVAHVVASLHRTSEPDADAPDVFLNLRELLLWANHDSPDTARDVVNLSEVSTEATTDSKQTNKIDTTWPPKISASA